MFRVFWKVFRGVPGFLEGVPGCSGFSRRCSGVFRIFHTVPGVPGCSGCSGVPVFLELLHAQIYVRLGSRKIYASHSLKHVQCLLCFQSRWSLAKERNI